MTDLIQKGTPTIVMLPAKRWGWQHISGPHVIDLPKLELAGIVKFDLADDIDVHISCGGLLKSLLTNFKYPKLGQGEVFAISDILVNKDEGFTVVGNVLKQIE